MGNFMKYRAPLGVILKIGRESDGLEEKVAGMSNDGGITMGKTLRRAKNVSRIKMTEAIG